MAEQKPNTPRRGDDRPPAGGAKGGPPHEEHRGPPDYAPETGGPAFSKGGHLAGDPGLGKTSRGDHELSKEKQVQHGSAEPPRR